MFLNLDTIPHFYKNYVKLIEASDVSVALRLSGYRMLETIHGIPEKDADFAYGPDKWTIRELLCHVIDAERIFAYRALRFARQDRTPLAPFNENAYAPLANASNRSLRKIGDELQHLRTSTLDLFESFTPDMMNAKGIVGENELAVAALGYIIAGHETHHRKILVERYLTALSK